MGVIDDKTKISVTFRLIAQLVLMTFMVDYVGISDVGVFLFSIFLSMYILNSFNFMDGIDSLAISEFIFIIIGFLILHYVGVTQSFQPTFYYLLIPAIAFSLFNLHPSKLFLGNSGSYLLGFLIALNFVTYGTWLDFFNMLVPLIILYTIFFIETAYVIIRRFTNNLYRDFMDSSLSLGSILTSRTPSENELLETENRLPQLLRDIKVLLTDQINDEIEDLCQHQQRLRSKSD